MYDLSSFFAENAEQIEDVKVVVSKRFKGLDKKPIEWILRPITSEQDEALRKDCAKRVQIPGRKGLTTTETDNGKYSVKMAAACVVFPDLKNAELQNTYGVKTEEALLKAMLLPGELIELVSKAQDVCGYELTMDELVDEAKNSSVEATATQM